MVGGELLLRQGARKSDWGELARGRIHQLPSNTVRTSLRYSFLSHEKEWKPASGKKKQGPNSEVISLLAILFAHPLLLHMFTNIYMLWKIIQKFRGADRKSTITFKF